jgi:hypothetical protein
MFLLLRAPHLIFGHFGRHICGKGESTQEERDSLPNASQVAGIRSRTRVRVDTIGVGRA